MTVARCFVPTGNSCTIQSSLRPRESQLARSDFRRWRSQASIIKPTVDDESGGDAGMALSVARRRRARVDAGVVDVRPGDVQLRHSAVERLTEVGVVGRDQVVVLVPAHRRRPRRSGPASQLALERRVFALGHRHVDGTSHELHRVIVGATSCRTTTQRPPRLRQ